MLWVLWLSAAATIGLIWYVLKLIPHEMELRYLDSFRAFSRAVELRFSRVSGQTDQVRRLSRMVGHKLGLGAKEVSRLEAAAMLRDLGLCAIPYRLLNRLPADRWTEVEAEQFAAHPEIGATMLEMIPSLKEIAPIVREQQIAEATRMEARILRVVSAYVRIRAEQGPDAALQRLRSPDGGFDPQIVEALASMLVSTVAAVQMESDVIAHTR